jgi:hypothetical protein
MKMKKILYVLFLSFSFLSCKKTPDPVIPNSATSPITVIAPSASSNYQKDDTIFIKANIADDQGIHEVIVNVVDLSTATTIFHLHQTYLSSPYMIDTFYVVTTSSTGISYRVEFFESNHSGNTSQEDVLVNIVP